MSSLKERYVEKIGYDYERIKTEPWYLAQLALEGALEIDFYLLGKNNDFSHVQELADILREYQLKDSDNALTCPYFPYLPIWRAMKKDSDKNIGKYSGLALEMRLLNAELNDIPFKANRIKELSSFLCDLSREFSSEHRISQPFYLAA